MGMLDAGGLPPIEGSSTGSYEVHSLIGFNVTQPKQVVGRAVKLLDYAQWFVDQGLPAVPWRFIWSDRDPGEQAKSNVKLMGAVLGEKIPISPLRKSYVRDRSMVLDRLRSWGEVMTTSFETVLADPTGEARRLAAFLAPLDVDAMAAVVERRLPRCAPDLSRELRAIS
jgi:hypothetical protein